MKTRIFHNGDYYDITYHQEQVIEDNVAVVNHIIHYESPDKKHILTLTGKDLGGIVLAFKDMINEHKKAGL